MKKLFVMLSLSIAVISCGGGNDTNTDDSKKESAEEAKEAAPASSAKSPEYQKGLELVAKSDCFTCHDVSQKKVGPAYKDVAAKYGAPTDETVEKLAAKVISGGAGNWGTVPMTPHPQLPKDDAKTMVRYILELKK